MNRKSKNIRPDRSGEKTQKTSSPTLTGDMINERKNSSTNDQPATPPDIESANDTGNDDKEMNRKKTREYRSNRSMDA